MDERRRLIRELLESNPRPTGAHVVRMLRALDDAVGRDRMTRREFVALAEQELGYNKAHGGTYHDKYYLPEPASENLPPVVASQGAVSGIRRIVEPFPTTRVRDALRESAEAAVEWYLTRSAPITRVQFLRKGGIADTGRGAVYSYHSGDDEASSGDRREVAIYVGITGYRVKSRLKTPTSPHERSAWWNEWTYMRFVPMEEAGDRQTLEYLLILGLAPSFNRRPSAMNLDRFLPDQAA